VSRSDVERQLTGYVDGDDRRPCVLSGPPGSGKSAILAYWVRERTRDEGDRAEPEGKTERRKDREKREFLLARFVGASPNSINLSRLLANLTQELVARFALTEEIEEEIDVAPGQKQKRRRIQPMEVPADPAEIVRNWPRVLAAAGANGRVVLVVDAVNQLERGSDPLGLAWLPRELPTGVRMIVSALDHGQRSHRDYRPGAGARADWLSVLRSMGLSEVSVPELDGPSRRRIISELPSVFCKSLDDRQKDELLKNQATSNPLFLTVALEELRVFGSFQKLAERIRELPRLRRPDEVASAEARTAHQSAKNSGEDSHITIPLGHLEYDRSEGIVVQDMDQALDAMFGQVLDRLDREASREAPGLVAAVFRLLASARDGLSEAELRGLLARTLGQIPESRRNGAMEVVLRQVRSCLMRKGALVDFYHRSFWKAVRTRYLPDDTACRAGHAELAVYFHDQDCFLESTEAQRQRAMTVPYTPRPVNLRKVHELPWQRLQAQQWDEVETLFTDLDFLEAKNEAGLVYDLANDFSAAVAALPDNRPWRQLLQLLQEALLRDIHFIACHTHDYPQGLFQCLWNHAAWYDCPDAAAHYEHWPPLAKTEGRQLTGRLKELEGLWEDLTRTRQSRVVSRTDSPRHPVNDSPSTVHSGPRLCELMRSWREKKEQMASGFWWLRSLRPPPSRLATAQLAVWRGHKYLVRSVAISPGGDRIVSGSWDGTVRVWDARSFQEPAVLRGQGGAVESVSYSPDGTLIVSGSRDGTVGVWHAQGGAEPVAIRGHIDRVESVRFSPDGTRIVTGSSDNTVRVWDACSGTQLAECRGHEFSMCKVSISPRGDRFVRGWLDNTVRVWDLHTGAELAVLRWPGGGTQSVSQPPGRVGIIDDSQDNLGNALVEAFEEEGWRLFGEQGCVTSVNYSPDAARIVSGSWDGTVRVWDAHSFQELAVLRGHKYRVTSVSYSSDGRRIAGASENHSVRVWDAATGEQLEVIRGDGELAAIADGAARFPWRLLARDEETVIEDAAKGQVVARFPQSLSHTVTHPSGRSWAGGVGSYLCVFRLEGGERVTTDEGRR
jgi:WD40 repeat protein